MSSSANCSGQITKRLCETLVRPLHDFCCVAWDPYHRNRSVSLERIQERCARRICRDWTTDCSVLLQELGWSSLEDRRRYTRLVTAYKIMNGLTDTGRTCMFNPTNRISRNDHTLKVQVPFAKTDYFKNSFYIRTANN